MSKINLLPWREELRKEKQQQFFVILGICAAIAVGAWGLVHYYHTQLIDYQQQRNKFMEEQIALLDKKIEEIKRLEKEKERLLARMRAIEQLQGNRPLIVRMFDAIVNSLPEGVSLTKIKQVKDLVTINGIAQSNARVSSFMRNIEASKNEDGEPVLKDPQLDIIQVSNADSQDLRLNNFTLRFKQVIPRAEEEEE